MIAKRTLFLCAFVSISLAGSPLQVFADQSPRRAASKTFNDELTSFQPRDKEEAAIKSTVRKIKDAYEKCDKRPLLPAFSENYKQAIFMPPSSVMIISRAKYFTGLTMGKVTGDECKNLGRRLIMANINVGRSEGSRDRIDLALVTTYASKYFNPRFVDKFTFRRREGKMQLQKRISFPLYPKSEKYYHPEIYISKLSEYEKHQGDLKQMALDDADIFIERILKGGNFSKSSTLSPGEVAVIVVFKEPPPPGAKIKIAHRYYNQSGDLWDEYDRTLTIKKVAPWFFIGTASEIGSGMASVTYEVSVDGKKVLERSYEGE